MKTIILTAAAVLVLGSASVQAQDFTVRQAVVRYDDIDVAKAQGAQILYARIEMASEAVCGYRPANIALYALRSFKACSEAAKDSAIKSLPFDLAARMDAKPETLADR